MAAAVVRGREILASWCTRRSTCTRPTAAWCRSWRRAITRASCRRWSRRSAATRERDARAAGRGGGDGRARAGRLAAGRTLLRQGTRGAPRASARRRAPRGRVIWRRPNSPTSDSQAPYLGLVVSGGHTALYRIEADAAPALLGETRDDAVGEAFDKVAKLLGLPFPGGPALAREAEGGDECAIAFPRPMLHEPRLRFLVQRSEDRGGDRSGEAPQRGPLDAGRDRGSRGVVPGRGDRRARHEGAPCARARRTRATRGGRRRRREPTPAREVAKAASSDGFLAVFPPLSLCTDNAAMIAAAGARRLARGERDDASLGAFARASVDYVARPADSAGAGLSRGGVRALLERHGLRAHKTRGQNFLTDERIAAQIADDAPVGADDAVIEIGPGLGVLTRALAARARQVVAIEIDAGLVRALRAERWRCRRTWSSCTPTRSTSTSRRSPAARRAARRSRALRGAGRRESALRDLVAAAAPPARPARAPQRLAGAGAARGRGASGRAAGLARLRLAGGAARADGCGRAGPGPGRRTVSSRFRR